MQKQLLGLILNGMILSLINYATVAIGFMVYLRSGSTNQLFIQHRTIMAGTIIIFTLYYLFINPRLRASLRLESASDLVYTYLLCFVVTTILAVPAHYLDDGVWAWPTGAPAIWGVQVWVNPLALACARSVGRLASGVWGTSSSANA